MVAAKELLLSEDSAQLLELLVNDTDYDIFAFMPADPGTPVTYFEVQDSERNTISVGTSPFNDTGWVASFPFHGGKSPVFLPLGEGKVNNAREAVDAAKKYMGPTLTPNPEDMTKVYPFDTLRNARPQRPWGQYTRVER